MASHAHDLHQKLRIHIIPEPEISEGTYHLLPPELSPMSCTYALRVRKNGIL
jgi:hypothetical protein